jgi:hypothetical protein
VSATGYGRAALASETTTVRLAEEGTRSDLLSRAAYRLGQLTDACGLDQVEVSAELLDAALIAGLGEWEARRTIRSSLRKGEQTPRRPRPDITSKDDAVVELCIMTEVALRQEWGGLRGKRCITVLMGVLTIARQEKSVEVTVPLRRLMFTIGTRNRQYTQRGLRDLVEEGWLVRVSRGGPGHAARYRVRFPPSVLTQATTTHTPNEQWPDYAQTIGDIGADAYRSKALDKTAWRILRHFADRNEWSTQIDVARTLGISASTVSRQCRPEGRLVRYGLVSRSPLRRGSVRLAKWTTPAFVCVLAHKLGAEGLREKDRADLVAAYIDEGFLTDGLFWIDQHTGEPTQHRATWLLRDDPPAIKADDDHVSRLA